MASKNNGYPALGFWGLVTAHSLGAFNDNAVRWFLIALTLKEVAQEGRALIVSLGSVLFLAPVAIFSMHAGLIADKHPKKNVLLVSKAFEGVLMLFCALALFLWPHFDGQLAALLITLLFLGVQATYYSPAKYGTIPEMLPERYLSWGNGIFEMTGVCAIIIGSVCGSGFLFFVDRDRDLSESLVGASLGLGALAGTFGSAPSAAVSAIGISVGMDSFQLAGNRRFLAPLALSVASLIGFLGTALVPRYSAALALGRDRPKAFSLFLERCQKFFRHRVIVATILAIIAMWSFGLLLQLNLALYAEDTLGLPEHKLGAVMAVAAIGVAAGNVLAGYISGKTIELGLAPLGAAGGAFFLIALRFTGFSLTVSYLAIWFLGVFAGLFIVPLHANLQEETEDADKGGVWGMTNCLQTVGMLVSAGSFVLLQDVCGLSAPSIFFVAGVAVAVLTVVLVISLPECLGRLAVWLLVRTSTRVVIEGQKNVPPRGPILFLAAAESPQDLWTVLSGTRRFVRFVMPRPEGRDLFASVVVKTLKALFYPTSGPTQETKEVASQYVRGALSNGEAVCLLTRHGSDLETACLPQNTILEIVEALRPEVVPVRIERIPDSRTVRVRFERDWRRGNECPRNLEQVTVDTASKNP